jgi:hypothetical protein
MDSVGPALEIRAKRFQKSMEPKQEVSEPKQEVKAEEPVKAKPKGKAKQKAAPKKSVEAPVENPEKEEVQNPQQAGSVSPVAEPAKVQEAGSVPPVEVQAQTVSKKKTSPTGKGKPGKKKTKPKKSKQTSSTISDSKKTKRKPRMPLSVIKSPPREKNQEPWGEHTFESRWLRERERSPLIAQILTPGSKRVREYNGRRYELKVKEGYYLLNGEKFPTLYSTVLSIAGGWDHPVWIKGKKAKGKVRTMANWSGPKFWLLKSLEA